MTKSIYGNPGHWVGKYGRYDPGAIGPTGLKEADVVYDMWKRLSHLLREKGYKTLGGGHEYLVDAAKNANQLNADLFISLHCNSSTNNKAKGTEIWYHKTGKELASHVLKRMLEEMNDKDRIPNNPKHPWYNWMPKFDYTLVSRGIKSGNFYVIRYTHMPAILIETAFINNYTEEKLLKSATFKQQMCQAIADGVDDYFKR